MKNGAVHLVSPVVRRFKKARLALGATGGFPYARIATMITKRITKKVKKSYFVIGLHPIPGARIYRLDSIMIIS